MKPLILILLAATYAAAQAPTIADIARQERARRAPSTSTKVYTTADIKKPEPKVEGDAQAAAAPDGAPTPPTPTAAATSPAAAPGAAPSTTAPAASAPAAVPVVDPVQQWLADSDKLRNEIREIIDREAVTQLEINAIQNRANAPVTTVGEKDRAFAELGVAQTKLTGVRDQLAKKRAELQARELAGPPKK